MNTDSAGQSKQIFYKCILLFYTILLCFKVIGCSRSEDSLSRATIAVIPMGTTHEFWKTVHAGALTAAIEGDVDIIWKGPLKEDDREEQIQIIENFIAAGVDAIVLSPLDNRAMIQPVRQAADRGIPTVLIGAPLEGDVHRALVATDNFEGGAIGARHLGSLMGGRGNALIIRYQEGVASTSLREEGFLTTIRDEYPNITILTDNQYGGVTTESAYSTTEILLNRFSEINGIFCPNESTTFGCLRALEDFGRAGDITLVGFDSSVKLIEGLEEGHITALLLQDPFTMGYEGVTTALNILAGKPVEPFVNPGARLATRENMRDSEIAPILWPDLSVLDK